MSTLMLARQVKFTVGRPSNSDSRKILEAWGFEIVRETPDYYEVTPPEGVTWETQGFGQDWLCVKDPRGEVLLMQHIGDDQPSMSTRQGATWDTTRGWHMPNG